MTLKKGLILGIAFLFFVTGCSPKQEKIRTTKSLLIGSDVRACLSKVPDRFDSVQLTIPKRLVERIGYDDQGLKGVHFFSSSESDGDIELPDSFCQQILFDGLFDLTAQNQWFNWINRDKNDPVTVDPPQVLKVNLRPDREIFVHFD